MTSPVVSILVPIYGVEAFIEACAESLFAQSYEALEYVFVDDCTPDASIARLKEVMERHVDRAAHVTIVRHDHNRGLGAARATAFQKATGSYVMHVDSDDLLPLDAVETLVRKALETDADMVDGAFQEWFNEHTTAPVLPFHGTKEALLRRLLCQNVVEHNIWGRLYRRQWVADNGVFSIEGIDYSEDFAVVPRLVSIVRRAWTDRVVYLYRTDNATSYTHSMTEKHCRSYLRSVAEVYRWMAHRGLDRCYSMAMDIGMVNVWRVTMRGGFSADWVSETISRPISNPLLRLLAAMERRRWPRWMVDVPYLAIRRIYVAM